MRYLVFMAVHSCVDRRGIYFITFTCFRWLPLIELSNGHDLIYKWFDWLAANKNHVLGYVIMPNHLHFIIQYAGMKQSLNTIIGSGKRFMAYEIVTRLKQKGEITVLRKMVNAVNPKDRQRNKEHEVWQKSFDVKECRTEKFLIQKLNYMHDNPVSGKWKLCEHAVDYRHSSFGFYCGKKGSYVVKDYLKALAEEFEYTNSSGG
jgi:REP element-mobilizing transposase RayT